MKLDTLTGFLSAGNLANVIVPYVDLLGLGEHAQHVPIVGGETNVYNLGLQTDSFVEVALQNRPDH